MAAMSFSWIGRSAAFGPVYISPSTSSSLSPAAGGRLAVGLQDAVNEHVGVAVPQAELALEHVAELAVLRQAARSNDFRERVE